MWRFLVLLLCAGIALLTACAPQTSQIENMQVPTPHLVYQVAEADSDLALAQTQATAVYLAQAEATAIAQETQAALERDATATANAAQGAILHAEAMATVAQINIAQTQGAERATQNVVESSIAYTQEAADAEAEKIIAIAQAVATATQIVRSAQSAETLNTALTALVLFVIALIVILLIIGLYIAARWHATLEKQRRLDLHRAAIYRDPVGKMWKITEDEYGDLVVTPFPSLAPPAQSVVNEPHIIDHEPIPINHNGEQVGEIDPAWRSPLSDAQERIRVHAMELTTISRREFGDYGMQILPASKCPGSNATWQDTVRSLGEFLNTKKGRDGGTFLKNTTPYQSLAAFEAGLRDYEIIPQIA